jgi:uncharacterized repeat protein (TIGR01451 family)
MKHGSWLPALAALCALLTLASLAGAGRAATGRSQATDRSTTAAPLVVQTGKRNYAGPLCPGKGWTCTTARRVLQSGDDNRFECGPQSSVVTGSSTGGTQTCVIVQNNPGGRNSARCIESTHEAAGVQVCTITQTGASNSAAVDQVVTSRGDTQSASQTATVTQNGATSANTLTIHQHVGQTPGESNADTVQQDAWQRADVIQAASGDGSNSADIAQDARQHAVGGTTQLQNTLASPIGDCYAPTAPTSPNICANVAQTSDAGDNDSDLSQGIEQKAQTNAVATQQQGSFAGGLDGRIHQETGPTGHNVDQAVQDKSQQVHGAAGSTQTQHDPAFCCGAGSQAGGTDNTETIDQESTQKASEAGATQTADLIGESLTPKGTCTVTQQVTNNADTATNSATLTPCPFLLLETSCTNGRDGDVIFGSCTASDPVTTEPGPASQLTKSVRTIPIEGPPPAFAQNTTAASGETVQYQIVYANTGSGTAHDVVVTDTIPPEVEFVADTCTPAANCSVDGSTLTWRLGDIPAGGTSTLTFSAVYGPAASCDNAVNSANATDAEDESANSNNSTVFDFNCIQ